MPARSLTFPALRRGKPYASLDQVTVNDCRTGEAAGAAQPGQRRHHPQGPRPDQRVARPRSNSFPASACWKSAARLPGLFLNETLPLGDQGHTQTPQQYVETLSATSGLPFVMVRRNMEKIATALRQMRTILNGLTRGLDLGILDRGLGEQAGAADQLLCRRPLPRPGHAEQFARRSTRFGCPPFRSRFRSS